MNVEEAIRTRRSIRAYEDKPLEDEKLQAVLEAARLAPSARNDQEWKFLVVRDAATRAKLVDACKGQRFVAEASVVIAGCSLAPERRMSCGLLAGPIDLAIAIDHMTLRATELGLGTCWLGAFYQDQVKEILGVPEGIEIVQLMVLGYPSEDPKPRDRKPLGEIVCYDKWS